MTNAIAEQLETFKSFYPDLHEVQALTVDDVNVAMNGQPVDWNTITPADLVAGTDQSKRALAEITQCEIAIGFVIFDVICLAIGAVGLRKTVGESTVVAMANAAKAGKSSILSEIGVIIAQMSAQDATVIDLAFGMFHILKTIKQDGNLNGVFKAFKRGLNVADSLLYGVTGTATIVALFETDGLALAAEIMIRTSFDFFLTTDVVYAAKTCSPNSHPSKVDPTPGESYKPNVAISTFTGNFITVVNNGGLSGPNDNRRIIRTDMRQVGPWEKFKLVPIDMAKKTFALQTMTDNFLGATKGGGLGGPDDASSPIHTDATKMDANEKLVVIKQEDGTYAICTTTGYFLTPVNGGGLRDPNDKTDIIRTDATKIDTWETFTFHSL